MLWSGCCRPTPRDHHPPGACPASGRFRGSERVRPGLVRARSGLVLGWCASRGRPSAPAAGVRADDTSDDVLSFQCRPAISAGRRRQSLGGLGRLRVGRRGAGRVRASSWPQSRGPSRSPACLYAPRAFQFTGSQSYDPRESSPSALLARGDPAPHAAPRQRALRRPDYVPLTFLRPLQAQPSISSGAPPEPRARVRRGPPRLLAPQPTNHRAAAFEAAGQRFESSRARLCKELSGTNRVRRVR